MEELNKENLKVIRLDNGEILFTKISVTDNTKNDGYLELQWPMKVLMKFNEGEKSTSLALLKWLPFTDTTTVPLASRCIMTVSNLGEEYKDFYINSVREDKGHSAEQERNKMAKILADFDPQGFIN